MQLRTCLETHPRHISLPQLILNVHEAGLRRASRNNGDEEEVARKALANVYGDEGKIEQSIAFSFSLDESS